MFFSKKKDLVGVDLGSRTVKVVQLKEVKGVFYLQSIGMASLPPEAIVDNAIMDSSAIVDVVKGLMSSLKIKEKSISTSISGHSVIIRKIQLPIMNEEELEGSIQFEAEQYVPFDINEVFLDFYIVGNDQNDHSMMNVVLVAAKKDFVNDHIAVFKECGLTPMVMDIDSFALQNAFEQNYIIEDDVSVAIVNMGAGGMNVNVLKGGASIFTRDIQSGGNLYNEEIQKQFGLNSIDAERAKIGERVSGVDPQGLQDLLQSTSESLAQEIQRNIDFFANTSSDEVIRYIYITGGISCMSQIKTALEERMGLPVEVLDPFRQIVVNEKQFDTEYLRSIGPMFAVAVGLAMRRVGDKND